MTTEAEKDTIIKIGKLMLRNARLRAEEQLGDPNKWDYAGYVFQEGGGDIFLFHEKEQYSYSFGDMRMEIWDLFVILRDLTRVEGDKPWIKCKAVIRSDGELKMLFEFDDEDKWNITPRNLDRKYDILIGDIFPDE